MMKVYKTIIDTDGTKWEAIPTKPHHRDFDIYKNGVNQDRGAHKTTDIEPCIEFLKERDREADIE
jgi:hypothetical protein